MIINDKNESLQSSISKILQFLVLLRHSYELQYPQYFDRVEI